MREVPWRNIRSGLDYLSAIRHVSRHRHFDAYATLVLHGSFEQVSYAGRLQLQAGDLLIQPTFDCHADRMISRSLVLCRLPWRPEAGYGGIYRNCRVDVAQALAERDIREAVSFLENELDRATFIPSATLDWVDELASDLRSDARIRVAQWARAKGVTREHVSRSFSSVYGASPAQFRFELTARTAWLRTVGTKERLSKIAADLGFSDQAHMTRAVKALTGQPPVQWRRGLLSQKSTSAKPSTIHADRAS